MIVYEIRCLNQFSENEDFKNSVLIYKSDEPESFPIFSPKYKIEVNTIGSMTFTIGVGHQYIDSIKEIISHIIVKASFIKNNVVQHTFYPFAGRVIDIQEDYSGNKEVTCEGVWGILNEQHNQLHFTMRNGGGSGATVGDVLRHIFEIDMPYKKLPPGTKCVFNPIVEAMDENRYYSVEHIYGDMEDGSYIETDSENANKYWNDYSVASLWDMVSNHILNKYGGFILQCNDLYSDVQIKTYFKYYPISIVGVNLTAVVPYPNEDYDNIEFNRWSWIPYFEKGKNIITLNKEDAITNRFSGILPIGKDNLLIDPNSVQVGSDCYIWNNDLVSLYKARIPYVVNFSDIDDAVTLRSNATTWLNAHRYDAYLPKKYTITGPEPCELGYGNKMIMLMRDVTIREDPSEDLINCIHLPCLSMEIDIQNPQNNRYVISPFIDTAYTNTSITKFSGNRV